MWAAYLLPLLHLSAVISAIPIKGKDINDVNLVADEKRYLPEDGTKPKGAIRRQVVVPGGGGEDLSKVDKNGNPVRLAIKPSIDRREEMPDDDGVVEPSTGPKPSKRGVGVGDDDELKVDEDGNPVRSALGPSLDRREETTDDDDRVVDKDGNPIEVDVSPQRHRRAKVPDYGHVQTHTHKIDLPTRDITFGDDDDQKVDENGEPVRVDLGPNLHDRGRTPDGDK